jgi:hypothetical protein
VLREVTLGELLNGRGVAQAPPVGRRIAAHPHRCKLLRSQLARVRSADLADAANAHPPSAPTDAVLHDERAHVRRRHTHAEAS